MAGSEAFRAEAPASVPAAVKKRRRDKKESMFAPVLKEQSC
jgi:hypothetical protein